MAAKLLLLILVGTITAVAQSTPTPYSVKADKLGETVVEWEANNPRSARCDDTVLEDFHYSGAGAWIAYCLSRDLHSDHSFTYGAAPLLTQTAWFYNGSLQKLDLTLVSSDALSDIIAGLKAKFGKPASKQTVRLQNGFGSRFEQKRWTWTNRLSVLDFIYSSVPGDRPRITFTLTAPGNETQSRQDQRAKACADM
ncbi:MAG TPA: hypothetical protein VFA67_09795 [Candidatus Sulfotelmatobacter sp.]|nr:hypothetical protein [Candidatus Sulfotelmatobacter sp.]